MRSRLLVALLVACTFVARGSAQQPVFRSPVELVTVDVVVFDAQGNPVTGLTQNDFTVREEGRPQQIAAFEAVSVRESPATTARAQRISTNAERPDAAGRWFFVVFDDMNITQFSTPRAREVLTQFIDQALRPGDRLMIAPATGGSNWTGELPRDREDLIAYVQRLQGERRPETGALRIWDHEAMAITLGRDPQAQAQVARRWFESGFLIEGGVTASPELQAQLQANGGVAAIQAKARQTYTEARSRIQQSVGTLERLSSALAEARGRKTLLFVSEGFIMDTTLPNFRSLLQAARNANVAIHFVDVTSASVPGGVGMPGAGAETRDTTLNQDGFGTMRFATLESEGARSIAKDTGGTTITGVNLLDGLRRIANEGRAYYLLGYTPTDTRRDGRFRRIEVTVNRPGVTVRARQGYFAAGNERESPRPDRDALDPTVRAGLDSPFGAPGIPLRMTSYVFGPAVGGKVQTLLVAEADPTPLRLQPRDGRYTATFDSYVLIHDRSRDSLERNERQVDISVPADAFARLAQGGIPIQREFALEPGRYQATLLVKDRATGTIGSVRHEFEVPAPGQFRITTPIVTDVVQPPPAQGQAARPVPIARRSFKAGTRIAAAFEILGATEKAPAGPHVSVAYTLRRADGTQVAASQPVPLKPNARGQFSVTIGIALPAGAAGEHDLHLSVRDEAAVRVLEQVEPLTITP